ncbi:MAG TPA: hypothetical protein VGD67_25615 [Pseudonocardiaceae bacterium]
MSWYWSAAVVAGAAFAALILLVVRAVVLVRRARVLAAAYRRHLAARSAGLRERGDDLLAELARRRGRAPTTAPRTMR